MQQYDNEYTPCFSMGIRWKDCRSRKWKGFELVQDVKSFEINFNFWGFWCISRDFANKINCCKFLDCSTLKGSVNPQVNFFRINLLIFASISSPKRYSIYQLDIHFVSERRIWVEALPGIVKLHYRKAVAVQKISASEINLKFGFLVKRPKQK